MTLRLLIICHLEFLSLKVGCQGLLSLHLSKCHIEGNLCCGSFNFNLKHSDIDDEITYGPHRDKTCLRGLANKTGADQPGHPRSLISAFVIRFLESIMCKLATGEISTF